MLWSLVSWMEARDAATHPAMPRTAPQQRIIPPKLSIMLRLRTAALSDVAALRLQR